MNVSLCSFAGRSFRGPLGLALVALLAVTRLSAQIAYSETDSGDLSNDGLAPTSVSFSTGSNQVFGSTGRITGVDRDYFSFAVPPGYALTGIVELPGTTSGNVSFFGLQAGNQLTVATNTPDATGLLGWIHYSPANINQNLFSTLSSPSFGSSGFTAPLGAGNYSVWIQDFTAGTFNYGFDFRLRAVPEPSTYGIAAGVLAFGLILARRRRARLQSAG